MLMAMFIEIVGKNTEESLQNDLALFNALQEGRQAEMERNRLNSVKRRAKPRKRTALWDVSGKSSARC